ncbi:MAG: 1-(5-phosphoribosyl)-5-[(5-phosphoribosylamino)methylideneamino]imidazole-4-carboxamide isomerase [Ruminococcaceae bacterium]|nr:1-(5-phosphoribosyl)-5-[(5-phosphoribosylamino)methylideneamino]imidazole-4-carboxamide isomerase [Oscillospiraceae bacterium]
MKIFPAIDIIDGCAVRLIQGDYDKKTVYSSSPVDVAKDFEKQGAGFLHTVDLDGAKDGSLSNFETVRQIAKKTDLFIEIGGGIRDEERIKKYLENGVSRVILGTAALNNPDFLKRAVDKYKEKIAVGIDAKDGFVAVNGWLDVSKKSGIEFCKEIEKIGVSTVIYTDISRDGAQKGTNLELYKQLKNELKMDIVASGGITFTDEIKKLSEMGLYGAILGKALYTKAIDLKEAILLAGEQI